MNIFILRHGEAELRKTTDEVRELTNKGRKETEAVVSRRAASLQTVTQLWASPLVRAQQTAQIALNYFPELSIQTSELLVPDADPDLLFNWLQMFDHQEQSILLVSHQPLVGEVINKLCGKPAGFYPMGTSSLAAIHTPVAAMNMGELMWLDHV